MSLSRAVEDTVQKLNPIHGPIKAKVTQVYQDVAGYFCSAAPCLYTKEVERDKAIIPKIPIDPILNGDEKGIYSLPKIGSYVRVGFYQNDPNLPYIDSQLGDDLSLAFVKYGELLLSHSAKAGIKIDKEASWYQVAKRFFCESAKKPILFIKSRWTRF